MNANSSVTAGIGGQMGVMVRSGTSVFAYWQTQAPGPFALRVVDLSGRPAGQLLDGSGVRLVTLAEGQSSAYVEGLVPGHLYDVELGSVATAGFEPVLSPGPVQTPWLPHPDSSQFPHPYFRS